MTQFPGPNDTANVPPHLLQGLDKLPEEKRKALLERITSIHKKLLAETTQLDRPRTDSAVPPEEPIEPDEKTRKLFEKYRAAFNKLPDDARKEKEEQLMRSLLRQQREERSESKRVA